MTDKEALLSIIGTNMAYCNTLYDIRHELKCINLCNSCEYLDYDKNNNLSRGYPCFIHKIVDKILGAVPQLDLIKNQKYNINNDIKMFAFKIESYMAYKNDNDTFTKVEVLELVKEILINEYQIKNIKE